MRKLIVILLCLPLFIFSQEERKYEKTMSFSQFAKEFKEAANKGIVRCPEIGFMTHFDSPWDGMFAIDRLIRWTSLGGPH